MSAFPPRGFSIGPGPAGTFGSRRLKRQNLTTFLRERELGNFNAPVAPPNVHLAKHRHVYWIIYPRRTLYDVQLVHDHQHIVLRKFSPDGKVSFAPSLSTRLKHACLISCPRDSLDRCYFHIFMVSCVSPETPFLSTCSAFQRTSMPFPSFVTLDRATPTRTLSTRLVKPLAPTMWLQRLNFLGSLSLPARRP